MVIYAFLVAVLLVTGQTLWKLAATSAVSLEKFSLVPFIKNTILTPRFIAGALLYAIATLAYVWLFSRFSYSSVQLTLISFSIVISTLVAVLFFREHLTSTNLFGIVMILLGVFLVIWKK